MESQKKMMVVFGLVSAVCLQCVAAVCFQCVTGPIHELSEEKWTIPPNDELKSSLPDHKFVVGDSLIIKFKKLYDAVEVGKDVFDDCNYINQIATNNTGQASFTLDTPGEHYFICPNGHCQSGLKITINVLASDTSPGSSPSAPSTSTTTNTIPGVTAVPSSSSSPAAGAGFVLCSLSLIVGLFV